MNKKEFFDKVKDKIKENEFNSIWKTCEEEAKKRGVESNEIELVTIGLMQASIKKKLSSPSKFFEGVIFGINNCKPLNNIVDKVKNHSLEEKSKNANDAFINGFINENGNPIWHKIEGINVAEFKIGKEITLNDYQQTLLMLAKENEDENGTIKLSHLVLHGTKRLTDSKLLFKKVEFRANVSSKSTEDLLLLNESTLTQFNVVDDEIIDFNSLSDNFLGKYKTSLISLKDYIAKNQGDYNSFCIVSGNISNLNITAPGISNIITIDDYELSMDDSVTCWLDESFDINFEQNAVNILVIGSPNISEKDGKERISINVNGIWIPKAWRLKEEPKKIGEKENEMSEVVKDTEESW